MNFRVLGLMRCESGRRCFILANGPSILQHNLSLIKNDVVISLNASPMLEEKFCFSAGYYCLSDPRFFEDEKKRIIAESKIKDASVLIARDNILDAINNYSIEIPNLKKAVFLNPIGRDGFSKNLCKGYYIGASTTYLAVQLAYWMGCAEVYILGLDLQYQFGEDKYRFYSEAVTQEFDYLASVQLNGLCLASESFKQSGRKLCICNTESWATPYLDYVNFDKLFV